MGAKAVEGLTWRTRRAGCRVPPKTRLKRRGRLRMRTRWATPRRAAELLMLLLPGFGLVEPSGHSGNRGRVRRPAGRLGTSTPPGRPTVLDSGSGCVPESCHLCWTSERKGGAGRRRSVTFRSPGGARSGTRRRRAFLVRRAWSPP